jgi:hypoxanthine phosphoribosyltransferase
MIKQYISELRAKNYLIEIIRQMSIDEFKPDLVIGLVRGGTQPANYISQFYDIPCYMYNKDTDIEVDLEQYKNILVIDDINDSGSALTNINNLLFDHEGIKYATLISNDSSAFTVDYTAYIINRLDCTDWFVFPWENWWHLDSGTYY